MAEPKLCLHKATGQYYVSIKGKRHYLGVHKVTAEARRASILDAHARTGRVKPGDTMTVAEALAIYEAEALGPNFRYTNIHRHRVAVDAILAVCPDMLVPEFRSLALTRVRNYLLSKPRKISTNYINELIGVIRTIWRWLVSREIAPGESLAYLDSVTALPKSRPDVTPPAAGAVEDTLPACSPELADMIRLQLLTGCRPGELLAMRSNLIDYVGLEGPGGVRVWLFRVAKHKTQHLGKSRTIAIGPRAQAILGPYLVDGLGHLWPYARVAAYRAGIHAAIDRANRARGLCRLPPIPKWHPNQLRHERATQASEQYDREHAAAVLGHAGLDSVAVYAEQAVGKAVLVAAETG